MEISVFLKSLSLSRSSCDRGISYRISVTIGLAICVIVSHSAKAPAVPTFTNVTMAAGITHSHTPDATGSQFMSAGAAAADFDGDGLVDLFFSQVNGPLLLYRNTGNGFEDVSAAAGFTAAVPSSGTAAADVDNDGDLDLSLMGVQSQRHYLYINDGTGHFTEEAITRGADITISAGNPTRRGQGVAFGDYDRDGYVDMMTSEHAKPFATSGSRLLRNLGAANPGHFEDVTQAAGLDVYRTGLHDSVNAYRFQPRFSDIDQDGHTDILIVADERTSQLFWNNGDGTFTDGTVPAGVGTDKSGMGSALADYDRDGDLDWFITAIFDTPFLGVNPGNRLYRNNGDRTFTDVTTAAGVRSSGAGQELSWGWGTVFMDYDNDADQDLMMTNGFVSGYTADDTTLKRNNGNGTFTDVTVGSGITDTGQGRGLLQLDYDIDGDLDALVVNYGAAPILYRNDGGSEAHWLQVKTVGTVSNRDGIGAFIKVIPDLDAPDLFQVWEVHSGDSYLSQSEMTAHFGLGTHSGPIDRITIAWPSGILQEFQNVQPNSLLIAHEGILGDFNGDLSVDGGDLINWQVEFGQTMGTLTADADGDADVDGRDFLIWQRNYGTNMGQLDFVTVVPEPNCCWSLALLSGAVRAYRRGNMRSRA
jgi:hypothetical protein